MFITTNNHFRQFITLNFKKTPDKKWPRSLFCNNSEHMSCPFYCSLQCRDKQDADRYSVTKPINPLTSFNPSMCMGDDFDDDDDNVWEPNIIFYIQGTEMQRESKVYYYY